MEHVGFELYRGLFGERLDTVILTVWVVFAAGLLLVALARGLVRKIRGRPADVGRIFRRRWAFQGLFVGGLAAVVMVLVTVLPNIRTPQERAVQAIKAAEGEVSYDSRRPDKPVVRVSFRDARPGGLLGGALSDGDLGSLRPHLEALSQLRHLDLAHTELTDAGLVHLYGLAQLETLSLGGGFRPTRLTDAAVAKLRAALPHTKVYFYGGGIVIPMDEAGEAPSSR
jgi:hypothetical protein